MKRFTAALIIACAIPAAITAQEKKPGLTFGAELRYALTVDDMTSERDANWDVTLEYYPVMAELGVQWDDPFAGAGFTSAAILGFRGGYSGILETEAPDGSTSYALSTIPFGAFTRLEAGMLYLDVGIGAHRWALDYEVDGITHDNAGFGLATSLSAGVRAVLFRHVTLRTAGILSYYGIDDIGTGVPANSLTAGLVCGVNIH